MNEELIEILKNLARPISLFMAFIATALLMFIFVYPIYIFIINRIQKFEKVRRALYNENKNTIFSDDEVKKVIKFINDFFNHDYTYKTTHSYELLELFKEIKNIKNLKILVGYYGFFSDRYCRISISEIEKEINKLHGFQQDEINYKNKLNQYYKQK